MWSEAKSNEGRCRCVPILYYARDRAQVKAYTAYEAQSGLTKKKFTHYEEETGRWYQHVALEQASNASSAGEERVIGNRPVISSLGWRWSQHTFDARLAENPHLIYWTRTGRSRFKLYMEVYRGRSIGNLWTDIKYLASNDSERTGYPTKPLVLLDRIIRASSDEGDMVFDPFCGCATTLVAADRLQRKWICIGISPKAVERVVDRVKADQGCSRPSFPEMICAANGPRQDQALQSSREPQSLFGKQGGRCNGCRRDFPRDILHVDHRVARSKGGTDHIKNLQLLCPTCNSKKGTESHEYLMRVLERERTHYPYA